MDQTDDNMQASAESDTKGETSASESIETPQAKEVKRTVGDIIREARKKAGMRANALAVKVGVTPSYMSKIETSTDVPHTKIL